jgi:hypothetical protein
VIGVRTGIGVGIGVVIEAGIAVERRTISLG